MEPLLGKQLQGFLADICRDGLILIAPSDVADVKMIMYKWEGSELNKAKEILAYELTKLVHGEEEAKKALNENNSEESKSDIVLTKASDDDKNSEKIDQDIKDDNNEGMLGDSEVLTDVSVSESSSSGESSTINGDEISSDDAEEHKQL